KDLVIVDVTRIIVIRALEIETLEAGCGIAFLIEPRTIDPAVRTFGARESTERRAPPALRFLTQKRDTIGIVEEPNHFFPPLGVGTSCVMTVGLVGGMKSCPP